MTNEQIGAFVGNSRLYRLVDILTPGGWLHRLHICPDPQPSPGLLLLLDMQMNPIYLEQAQILAIRCLPNA